MKAIDYIKKGWIQEAEAKTKNGVLCHAISPLAVKWCAIGAITAAYSNPIDRQRAIDRLVYIIHRGIVTWNDDPKRTKKQVLAAFKKAGI